MAKQQKRYSTEFKQEAVRLATSGDKSKAQIARDLGISEGSLCRWIDHYGPALVTTPADLAPDPLSSTDSSKLKLVFEFTTDIIDKQYRSYVWNDGKVQALVTIDAALIAGIFLISQIYNHISVLPFSLLACSFFSLVISFVICLVHAIPKIHSGIGNQDNLRTMIGISQFEKEEYHTKITNLDLSDIVRMNCWQIAGMCKNNLRSHALIKWGVRLTIIGVLAIAIAVPIIVFSDWNRTNEPPAQQQSNTLTSPLPVTDSANTVEPTSSLEPQPADQLPVMPSSSATHSE